MTFSWISFFIQRKKVFCCFEATLDSGFKRFKMCGVFASFPSRCWFVRRMLSPDHLNTLNNPRKPNITFPFTSATMKSHTEVEKIYLLKFSLPFTKLLSWLTCLWTSPLHLAVSAKVSRCLFSVGFQSLIYAWDDNAVILQEREESITNGIHAKQALLFPLSEPPRLSADTLSSAEHPQRAHTVCHNSFSSITAGPAGLHPLYFQLGRLTPLNSKRGEAFGKIYKMTFRIKYLPPCLSPTPSLPLCGSLIQGFTVWKTPFLVSPAHGCFLSATVQQTINQPEVVLQE